MLSELEEAINARRRVYLLRHGEVSYFDSAGAPFRQDEVPLNEEGERQAAAIARALESVAIDRVVTSGLPRTVATARHLAASRGLEVEMHRDLREIAPGRMADHEPADRERVFTRALRGNIRRDTRFLGGESVGSLVDRVVPAFESLLAASDWRAMAIVAHGGTNRAILCRALGVGVEAFASLEQDAGCLNIIDVDSDSSFLVRLVNYTPYSPVKDGLRATTMERIWLSHVAPRPSGPPRTRGER